MGQSPVVRDPLAVLVSLEPDSDGALCHVVRSVGCVDIPNVSHFKHQSSSLFDQKVVIKQFSELGGGFYGLFT